MPEVSGTTFPQVNRQSGSREDVEQALKSAAFISLESLRRGVQGT